MRFLITGGAGFIGSHLCERLIDKGHDIICLDNFNSYYNPQIKRNNILSLLTHSRFRLVEGDILRWRLLEGIFNKDSIDCVIHLAARAGVRPSLKHPRLYQKVNVEGTTNLLEFSVRYGIRKFIMASSSSVYGNNKKVPFSEDDNVDHPISPYAATKKACELIGYTYHSLHALPVTCLRFFTVYGPRQRPDMAIHKFTQRIVEGKEIPVFGDGTSRRDYTYITDILNGIEKSINHCKAYHIYNLGESQTIDLRSLISLLEERLNKQAKIKWLSEQPGDVRITYADIGRAAREIDYSPTVDIRQGIDTFIQWFSEGRWV